LAVLHSAKNEFDSAESAYSEALNIYRELAKVNPQTYLPKVAMTLNNLAVLHSAKNEFDPAESAYSEALNIRREFVKVNPQTYLPKVAMTLINLGIFYIQAKPDKAQSVSLTVEALQILAPFLEKAPYTQRYADTAVQVLQYWEIDINDIFAS
jgi:tetratricopeptide (TPR) repeat protein